MQMFLFVLFEEGKKGKKSDQGNLVNDKEEETKIERTLHSKAYVRMMTAAEKQKASKRERERFFFFVLKGA